MQSVVKFFVQKSTPNYCMPWQMKRQQQSTGSGFVISGRRILTNAHVVAYQKSIRVRKHGDAKKYTAHIIHVAHECDLALVGVLDDGFWENLNVLELGDIPQLEEDIVVVGFPTGGDNISVTRGVVSRVDIQRYSHSGLYLLAIQIDAAINAGNSGGPALKHGKVTGVAFETLENAENIGYIIPLPVITHFLEDVEKNNSFSGFCELGIHWQMIDSEHLRKYFKMQADQTGVLISRVFKLSSSYNMLRRGDILMAIDGNRIADNGTIPFRGNERIMWKYLIHSKFPGDKVKATVSRAGETVELEMELNIASHLVPAQLYDTRPSYVVYGGLVFTLLSQPYMQHLYGKDWSRKAPIRMCDRIFYGFQEMSEQEVIVLSQVLASELTAGYDSFANLQLYKVNGIPILNLRHLCYVLDNITLPFAHPSKRDDKLASVTNSIETPAPSDADVIGTNPAKEAEPLESNDYVSLNTLSNEKENCEEENGTVSKKFSEFSRDTPDLYHNQTDKALLLDCENFIHFELDKDNVIVLDISAVSKNGDAILKQYAIPYSRSENLLKQLY